MWSSLYMIAALCSGNASVDEVFRVAHVCGTAGSSGQIFDCAAVRSSALPWARPMHCITDDADCARADVCEDGRRHKAGTEQREVSEN